MKTIRGRLADIKGSSIISVLVAFVILLLGIGAFATAIRTANDMVRRAEVLNAATGQVLERFYKDYALIPVDNSNFVISVKQLKLNDDGTTEEIPAADVPFKIHTKLREKKYELTMQNGSGGDSDSEDASDAGKTTLEYEMYYYK